MDADIAINTYMRPLPLQKLLAPQLINVSQRRACTAVLNVLKDTGNVNDY